jgi:hypothetical protein
MTASALTAVASFAMIGFGENKEAVFKIEIGLPALAR